MAWWSPRSARRSASRRLTTTNAGRLCLIPSPINRRADMGFMGRDRFNVDKGAGARGNPADFGAGASTSQRASFGSEQNPNATDNQEVLSSAPAGNPHSSRGFRKALEKTQRSQSRLKDQLPDKTT